MEYFPRCPKIPLHQERDFLWLISSLLLCLLLLYCRNIDQCQLLNICIFQTGDQCMSCIDGSQDIHSCLDRISADHESIFGMFCSLCRSIDNQIDLMSKDQIQKIR